MRRILTFLICGAIVISAGRIKNTEIQRPIKIALATWPGYAHAFIAQEKGFFKQNGVEAELVLKKEYCESVELYRSGKVDGIFEVFTDSIFHNSEGSPTKVVCIMDYSNDEDVIVAGPNIDSILDLKEKPVGIAAINSFSHLFVLSALMKAGLKEENLRFEIVPAQQVPEAISEGRIAAGHTWEPAKSRALKKGCKVIAKAGDTPGLITDVLSFNLCTTEKRPGEIRAILKALFRAREFIRTNKVEAVSIMAKAEGMKPEEMIMGLDGIIQPDREQNMLMMKKNGNSNSLFNIATTIYDFYGKRGRYFSQEDLDNIIDSSFLE